VRPTGFAQFKPINHNNKMLQFRNDSGFFPTRLGKPRSLRYTWRTRQPKPAGTEQGLLISVGSGDNARAVATHQSSRPVYRHVLTGTGSALSRSVYPNLTTLSTTGHRRQGPCARVPPVRKLACSQHSSCAARTAYEAAMRPQTPEEGRPGRNDSRCAGIRK
jgi:hypothetical protein